VKIAFFAEGYDPFINAVVTSLKALPSVLAQRGHEVIIFASSQQYQTPAHRNGATSGGTPIARRYCRRAKPQSVRKRTRWAGRWRRWGCSPV